MKTKLSAWVSTTIGLAVAGIALLGVTSSADAALRIQAMTTNGTPGSVDVTDGNTGDNSPVGGSTTPDGQILLGNIGAPVTVGDFKVYLSTTSSNRMLGSGPLALLESTSFFVANSTSSSRSFDLMITDTDYTFPGPPPLSMTSTASGLFAPNNPLNPGLTGFPVGNPNNAQGAAVIVDTYFNPSNTEFATDIQGMHLVFGPVLTTPLSTSYGGAPTDTVTPGLAPGGSGKYSLTIKVSVTVPGGYSLDSRGNSIQVQAVPEPATLMSMAIGLPLLGLGAWARRRRQSS